MWRSLVLLIALLAGFEARAQQIPAKLTFAVFDREFIDIANEDSELLFPLFTNVGMGRRQLAKTNVLLLYARLNRDGTVSDSGKGLRELIEPTGASIVVVAAPNPAEHVTAAAGRAGPKTAANIVLTIDRNGMAFPRFFRRLFERMRDGEDMLRAWVELAPQGPVAGKIPAPVTIMIAEGGRLVFPGRK
jgi:hypothetical protein